jgi:glucose/arabinose dehydrogenase
LKKTIAITIAAAALALVPSLPGSALPANTKVQVFAGDLDFPIDMAWVPGTKKIFFTEKGGAVRVISRRRVLTRPCVKLDVSSSGERGALGIALHPRFKDNRWLYVYYTNSSPLENRVTRFKVTNNTCTKPKHIVTGLSTRGATNHNGGHLEFVRGKLFVSTGEAAEPAQSQDTSSRLGKILRYNPNGTIPSDNPHGASNPVWATGLRNPFGLAHKPGTGRIYATDNGPHCDDELNLIRKGRNYGWGNGYQCGTAGVGPNPVAPIVRWSQIIVPTDPSWYKGKLKQLNGSLYMGDYGNGRLHRFVMNEKGTRVKEDRIIHRAPSGIVDVSKGPGGWLYFMTSSTIYRVVKK